MKTIPGLACWLLAGALALGTSPASAEEAPHQAEASALVPPSLVHFVEAAFPPSELEAQQDAAVLLQLSISETGEVVSVEVLESAGEAFDQAAVEAAEQFVFEPATMGGTPIPVRIAYRYQFTFVPQLEKKSTADFEGVVRNRETGEPLAGVLVELDDGLSSLSEITDEEGRFSFPDIAPGSWTVSLSGDGLIPVATEEFLEASNRIFAEYEVELRGEDEEDDDSDFEIVVTAPRVRKQVVSTEVLADQGRRVPGTQGDVLKVVENLPGVARSAAGSGSLVVWGAAPKDTRVYVDGIRIPRLYHDGGYRSVLHSDLVRSVELVPGAYGPGWGRGLGGIVAVQLRPLDEEDWHGSVDLNAIDAAGSTRLALTDDLHLALAIRRSHLHSVAESATRPFMDHDPGDVIPIPRYFDGQARLVYRLDPHSTVELGGLLSSDTLERTLLANDPSLTTRETNDLSFHRLYARYENRQEDGSVVSVVTSVGSDSSSLVNRYGFTPTTLSNDSNVYGLRASWRGPILSNAVAEVGVDGEVVTSTLRRSGSIGAPSREGDPDVFGRPPPGEINADSWKVTSGSVAPYGQIDFAFFDDRLHVVPGLRVEPFIHSTSRATPKVGNLPAISTTRGDVVIEPRLAARLQITERLGTHAGFGIYHQGPEPEDLSAVFGTPTLGLSSATHWLLGMNYRLTETLGLEATGFLSSSRDLVWRSLDRSPALAHALGQEGEGRSYGAQFLLRQDPIGPFFGWLSYSIVRSERKDTPEQDWRLFDFDQLHVLTAVGSLDLGAGFEVGARFRLSTGFPRTPVVGAYYDAANDQFQPVFGKRNGTRIPAFLSMDLRASKTMEIADTELELYLDIQNVTNHHNAEELVYSPNYGQSGTISGFPTLPMVGARWSW